MQTATAWRRASLAASRVTARPQSTLAAATASNSKPSLIESLFFDSPTQPALDEQYPGVPATEKGVPRAGVGAIKVESSSLSNGVRVASATGSGAYTTLAVSFGAGARQETTPGTAFVMKNLAFGATQRRSELKLFRDVEERGGSMDASVGRETASYSVGALNDHVDAMAEALAESVIQPRLARWEVDEAMAAMQDELAVFQADPHNVLSEAIHEAAFGTHSTLGKSILPLAKQLSAVDVDAVREYMSRNFVAGNLVFSGSNLEHSKLVDLADMYFLAIPEGKVSKTEAATVTGGERVVRTETGIAHVAVALEAPSASSKDVHALGVLQALLGAAPSGPTGPTQLNRLNEVVASSQQRIHSAASFALPYSDSGLVGIMASSTDANAGMTIQAIAGVLKDVAGAKKVSDAELARAKAVYRMSFASALDSAEGTRQDMASQMLLKGGNNYQSPADALKAIDAVTAADVQRVAESALKSSPSLAAFAPTLSSVPRYDTFASYFK